MSAKFPRGGANPFSAIRLLTKRVFSLFWSFISPKPYQKGCFFLYFCPYSNRSPDKKSVYSIIALILIKALTKWMFSLFLSLFLAKRYHKWCFLYFCHKPNQSPAAKDVFFYFTFFKPKPYLKGGFALFLPIF